MVMKYAWNEGSSGQVGMNFRINKLIKKIIQILRVNSNRIIMEQT